MSITTVLAGYAALTATLALLVGLRLAHYLRTGRPERTAAAVSSSAGAAAALIATGPPVGAPAPELPIVTASGLTVTGADLGSRYLVGFLSSTCAGCRMNLPMFVQVARQFRASGGVLAVVVGDERDGADLIEGLRDVATVLSEPDPTGVATRYQVSAYPTYVLVEDGVVAAAGPSLLELMGRRLAEG